MTETTGPLRPGMLLKERYRVDASLDSGAMGSIWRGEDVTLGRPVAIKVPHPEHLLLPGFRERFEREVRRLVSLGHPHIVPIYDAGRLEPSGVPYAVMAFLTGGNLEQRLSGKGTGTPPRLPPGDLAAWLLEIAKALDFIHAQGVIHRDVKPANILFDGAGTACVSDFGLSKALFGGEQSLTPSNTMVGSPAYVPPEAVRQDDDAEKPTGRYDQYSLATVVYEVVSGDLPFASGSPATVLLRKAREKPYSLGAVVPGLPPSLVAAVDRALSLEPADRFPTCAAFAAAALT